MVDLVKGHDKHKHAFYLQISVQVNQVEANPVQLVMVLRWHQIRVLQVRVQQVLCPVNLVWKTVLPVEGNTPMQE